MEFLKDLFPEGKALTYEELSKAARDKGFEVVNAAGGAYVPKVSVDTLTSQLNEANNKLKGYDPDWEKKMTAGHAPLKLCKRCRKPFIASNPDEEYCSESCEEESKK